MDEARVADGSQALALSDPFEHDLTPWLLRRLRLAEALAREVCDDAVQILVAPERRAVAADAENRSGVSATADTGSGARSVESKVEEAAPPAPSVPNPRDRRMRR